MQCIEEDGILKPFTRDSFGMALKACNAVINGVEMPIYKDPKTDRESGENFKKSQKGCIIVEKSGDSLIATDGHKYMETKCSNNLLKPVFVNGKMVRKQTLSEIRETLNDEF